MKKTHSAAGDVPGRRIANSTILNMLMYDEVLLFNNTSNTHDHFSEVDGFTLSGRGSHFGIRLPSTCDNNALSSNSSSMFTASGTTSFTLTPLSSNSDQFI